MTVYQEPAFPSTETNEGHFNPGMTLRDYFATQAMAACIGRVPNGTGFGVAYPNANLNLAMASYSIADAMLKAREAK